MDIDQMDQEEIEELVSLYVVLNKHGWPLIDEQTDDFQYACQLLLAVALVRSGVDEDTAIRQVSERDGKLNVSVENGELSIRMEFDEFTGPGVGITITEEN